jgi:hypothetical protein
MNTDNKTFSAAIANLLWSFAIFFVTLPFAIIFKGLKAQGTALAVMSADRRIKTEASRGITTVDASDRYNYNYF